MKIIIKKTGIKKIYIYVVTFLHPHKVPLCSSAFTLPYLPQAHSDLISVTTDYML